MPHSPAPLFDDTRLVGPQQALLSLLPRAARLMLWIAITLGILGTIIALIVTIARRNFAFSHYGPGLVWQWAKPPLIIALLFSLVWGVGLASWYIRRHHLAKVDERGLTIQRGRREKHYPWEQLSDLHLNAVQYGFPFWKWGSHTIATLSMRDRRSLRFRGPVSDLGPFTDTIKRYLYPRRLQDYRSALAKKEMISFGPIGCTSAGIMYRKKRYAWDEILEANLESGFLIITLKKAKGNQSLRIPAKKIANPDLCAQLIKNIEY